TSKQPYAIQEAIRKVRESELGQAAIALFHAFKQVQQTSSLYFKQKFGRLLRKQERDTSNDADSTGYQLTKILEVLSEK
ncbi:MAG: hypothetical protein AAB445_02970, partial [Patescibacteria group bacterium]